MNKYSYKYRPLFGYTGWTIEFFGGADHPDLIEDLLMVLNSKKPKLIKTIDLWMNEEIIYYYDSEMGKFELSRDNYDNVFITAQEEILETIHSYLSRSEFYISLNVNYNEYKLND